MKSKSVSILALLATSILFFVGCNSSTRGDDGDSVVNAPGKEIYDTNCSNCHGPTGEGDGQAGLNLKPRPRNYVKDGFKYGSRIEEIVLTVRDGLEDTDMPPWGDSLSDDEIRQVAIYVRELASRKEN
ncbi:MAG: cytochrome c [Leptospirales bacterium]